MKKIVGAIAKHVVVPLKSHVFSIFNAFPVSPDVQIHKRCPFLSTYKCVCALVLLIAHVCADPYVHDLCTSDFPKTLPCWAQPIKSDI